MPHGFAPPRHQPHFLAAATEFKSFEQICSKDHLLYPSSSLLNIRWPYPPCRVSNATKCSANGLHSPKYPTGHTLPTSIPQTVPTSPRLNSPKSTLPYPAWISTSNLPSTQQNQDRLFPSQRRAIERLETSPPSRDRGPSGAYLSSNIGATENPFVGHVRRLTESASSSEKIHCGQIQWRRDARSSERMFWHPSNMICDRRPKSGRHE